jgi:hypothetical protein
MRLGIATHTYIVISVLHSQHPVSQFRVTIFHAFLPDKVAVGKIGAIIQLQIDWSHFLAIKFSQHYCIEAKLYICGQIWLNFPGSVKKWAPRCHLRANLKFSSWSYILFASWWYPSGARLCWASNIIGTRLLFAHAALQGTSTWFGGRRFRMVAPFGHADSNIVSHMPSKI